MDASKIEALDHNDAIEWPNGLGFTPCTRAYAEIVDRMEAIKPDDVYLNDLSAEDYETFCQLDSDRCQMQMSGHLGKSVRY